MSLVAVSEWWQHSHICLDAITSVFENVTCKNLHSGELSVLQAASLSVRSYRDISVKVDLEIRPWF